ncbi:MAG: ParB/RepB/Spo0J family partition protein [Thermotogae bacterium]|nr:ParB/RepB/Spo0J family partition protein [Thermotogota bacterium]
MGRGLEAIFSQREEPGLQRYLPIDDIRPNPYQPRRNFSQEELKDLAESIKRHGLLQPIVVREREGYYEIIAGERRWRAAKLAGLDRVPAIIKEVQDEKEMLIFALIENLQREDLNPVEKALALKRLKEEFNTTDSEIGLLIQKSRSAVTNTLRLLDLPEEVLNLLAEGRISEGHARVLLRLADPHQQILWAKRVVEKGISVRELERILGKDDKDTSWVKEYEKRIKSKGLKARLRAGKRSLTLELKFKNREELEEFLDRI